ncbi:hypothetical protein AB0F45_27830 [Streptomyces achromogenes]|uniref:hypothetical protein n=1 Tax=Streptomyces achromogenes TaxID=67255 RepID=UPI0033D4C28A
MANTKGKRRQRSSIRPNGAGFQVRVYAGRDPLTKKDLYLHEQAETEPEAEEVRTRLLHQVDEKRHPKTQDQVHRSDPQVAEATATPKADPERTSHDGGASVVQFKRRVDNRPEASRAMH